MNRRRFIKYSFLSLCSLGGLLNSQTAQASLSPNNRWVSYLSGNSFGFLALGDMGTGWKNQYEIIKQMSKFPVQQYPALLLLGDLIYPSAKAELLEDNLIKPFAPLREVGSRFYPVWGNHDWLEAEAKHVKDYFAAPNYYTFGIGPAQFWALNSNKFNLEQASWLNNSLAASKAPWKLVFLHHSPYCSGVVHASNGHLIKNLCPIMEAHMVDLCLSGHNHLYERTGKINGVTYIVSGGGSASLHKYHEQVNYPRLKIESQHNFLKVQGNSQSLFLQALDIQGNTFDWLQMHK